MSDAANATPRYTAEPNGRRVINPGGSSVIGCERAVEAQMVADAFNERDEALARTKTLQFILLAILPPDRTDERIGWRGVLHEDKNQFSCEFCGASHLDFTEIAHAQDCPVALGRAALTKEGT